MATSEWKKPTDTMRVHRLRRRSSVTQDGSKSSGHTDMSPSCRPTGEVNRKRKNPFGCSSPVKKNSSDGDKENSPVYGADKESRPAVSRLDILSCTENETAMPQQSKPTVQIDASQRQCLSPQKSKKIKLDAIDSLPSTPMEETDTGTRRSLSESLLESSFAPQNAEHISQLYSQKGEVLPVDWSLKLKLRIMMQNALVSTATPTSSASALSEFVQNVPLVLANEKALMSSLQRCCNYWVHPNLPWFPEFPRLLPDSKIRKQVPFDVGLNTAIQKSLFNDWVESFTSLYQQVKNGLCPYFYVCCHQFTVLFRSPTVAGHAGQSACLTPTTRGIREALRREGVDFTMPNMKTETQKDLDHSSVNQQSPSGSSSGSPLADNQSDCNGPSSLEANDDDDVDERTDVTMKSNEGASVWLEDMGLDRKNFPTLEPGKVKIQREGYQKVDGRAESLVLCRNSQAQALFNFLLNCRSCIALTGPQAGIPPTLLSPTAFHGATLKSNKIRHSEAKLSAGTQTESSHVMEISGPLLPHHILNISYLLQENVPEPAILSAINQEHSSPFNLGVKLLVDCSTANRTESSVSSETAQKPGKCSEDTQREKLISNNHFKAQSQEKSQGFGKDSLAEIEGKRSDVNSCRVGRSTANDKKTCRAAANSTGFSEAPSVLEDARLKTVLHKSASDHLPVWSNGLHSKARSQLCVDPGLEEGSVLREIRCEPDGFLWV